MDKKQAGATSWISSPRVLIGQTAIGIGVLLFLEQFLHTGWLIFLALPAIGGLFLFPGIILKKTGLMIAGCIVGGLGLGAMMALGDLLNSSVAVRLGLFLALSGLGWLFIVVLSAIVDFGGNKKIHWWALIPGLVLSGVGGCFIFTELRFVDFVLFVVVSLSAAFLIWGYGAKILGLVISGCVLAGIGPGVYLAWGTHGEANALSRTGIMLLCFALGWGMITVLSKILFNQFSWWPLIPGGILAMVGWGLFLGGNPNSAGSLISNTGSIVLIIFGFYLMLMRNGIRR